MQVTFLGTGTSQGVPVIACPCDICASADPKDKRLRTSVMITENDKNFVIDAGPDFRQQLLREQVTSLEAVIFTHEHKDHVAGLDDVRAFNYRTGRDFNVYAHPRIQAALKREFPYAFEEIKYPGVPSIEMHTIGNEDFEVEGVQFTPIEVLHYKLPVWGYRVGDFVYITDANYIDDENKQKAKGAKVLVLNALRHQSHISHFTLKEAIALAIELEAATTYFTHISHQLGLHEDISPSLPENMFLAYDGLKLVI